MIFILNIINFIYPVVQHYTVYAFNILLLFKTKLFKNCKTPKNFENI